MKAKYSVWIAAALAALAMLMLLGGTDSTDASGEEKRIAQVLSAIEGAGRVEVALYYGGGDSLSRPAVPTGAVVVAQGAHDYAVRLQLIRAMRTLLGLSEEAVDVFAMEAKQ